MKNATRIVIVLDRSGSMSSARESTITGINKFIAEQKKNTGDISLKLVQFDSDFLGLSYELVFDKPIQEVQPLTQENFVPRGGTPLLDAQGKTIDDLGYELSHLPEWARPEKVMVVTITDGYENSSSKFTNEQIKSMIEHQTAKYKWDFVYIGANQDAVAVGTSMGYTRGKTMSYDISDSAAIGSTYSNLSAYTTRNVNSANAAEVSSNEFTEEERSSSLTGVDASLVGATGTTGGTGNK